MSISHFRSALPHPLHALSTHSVCVIVRDDVDDGDVRDKTIHKDDLERCAREYAQRFKENGVEGVDLVSGRVEWGLI